MLYGEAMNAAETVCRVAAPAKINLTLEVLGRRADGYHDIRSILVPVSLADDVELRESDGDRLEVVPDDVDTGAIGPAAENLALRAAGLLRRRAGLARRVAIRIVKRIPVGGGLGGGSADAAATLAGLNRLWGLDWPQARLMELAAELGSDVPALVHGGAVCIEGRGERVTPVLDADRRGGDTPGFCVLLVNPGLAISTGEIYRTRAEGLTSSPDSYTITHSALRSGDVEAAATGLFNGLEERVFSKYPVVGRLARQLKTTAAAGVLLSGSGATVFALVRNAAQAERIRRSLPGGYWSRVVWTLPDGVMAAHGFLEP
ncbi:MAG: 4-(cytidine 5'-diphospho)-2-C-methyl-D-erythritol kinase [Lentisphaerae bacterium]|nr:4-(cytidine 5'-diphospho)-2-C-methyl-D-erythritol kinase [Lentisphaerota bacterium]